MPFILGANSVSGYTVKNSLRFNSGSSDYLNRTFSTPTNNQKWTWSAWVKKCKNVSTQVLFAVANEEIRYISDAGASGLVDSLQLSTATGYYFRTNAVYRDLSAWYHIVVATDTTQATASQRVRVYVNGTEASTDGTYNITQNANTLINSAIAHNIGRRTSGSLYFDGYQSEIYFVDGQQLTPSSFGETDTDTGIWIPKAYTGTYGTNGFYLKFANSASLGTDSSGNGNNFTVNNLTSVDQTTDTPTNNFATMSPIDFAGAAPTLTNGNLTVAASSFDRPIRATMGFSKGKWYAEYRFEASDNDNHIGCYSLENSLTANYIGSNLYSWGLVTISGNKKNNAVSTAYGSAIGYANSIVMIAIDKDNGKIWWGKDGTWFNSGNPASGTNEAFSNINTVVGADGFVTFADVTYRNGSWNFGNPQYTGGSYTDGAGYGNFSYQVPSGFYSLCTRNLAQYG